MYFGLYATSPARSVRQKMPMNRRKIDKILVVAWPTERRLRFQPPKYSLMGSNLNLKLVGRAVGRLYVLDPLSCNSYRGVYVDCSRRPRRWPGWRHQCKSAASTRLGVGPFLSPMFQATWASLGYHIAREPLNFHKICKAL